MKHSKFYSLIFTCVLTTTSYLTMADEYIACNGCDYPAMQSKAFKKVKNMTDGDLNRSVYKVHTVSVSTGAVRSFSITSRPKLGRDGELTTAISTQAVQAPSILRHQTATAHTNFKTLQRSSAKLKVPENSGFTSAWQVTQNSSNMELLNDWIENHHSFSYWSRLISSGFGGAIFHPLEGTEWLVTFEDGSSLVLVPATISSSRLIFSYKTKSARDKDNNTIPDAGLSVQGEYTFRDEAALNDFLVQLEFYGVPVVVNHRVGRKTGPRVTITDLARK